MVGKELATQVLRLLLVPQHTLEGQARYGGACLLTVLAVGSRETGTSLRLAGQLVLLNS